MTDKYTIQYDMQRTEVATVAIGNSVVILTTTALLHQGGRNTIAPGIYLRLPTNHQWYQLDERGGQLKKVYSAKRRKLLDLIYEDPWEEESDAKTMES